MAFRYVVSALAAGGTVSLLAVKHAKSKAKAVPSSKTESENVDRETEGRVPIPRADYYMGIAFLSGLRSKDPQTQVGACLVNKHDRIVGIGYNGMPNHCNEGQLPWNRNEKNKQDLKSKYLYVCHAELNAIVNKYETDLEGSTIYVTMHPCNECAKIIIQSGITKVIYTSDKNKGKADFEAASKLFRLARVETVKFKPAERMLVLDFDSTDLCNDHKLYKKVASLQQPDAPVVQPLPCIECNKGTASPADL